MTEPEQPIYPATRFTDKDPLEVVFSDLDEFEGVTQLEHEDPCADNATRAEWALIGLRTFAERTRITDESPVLVMGDFLANLRHLCDALGINFDHVNEAGEEHHYWEIRGE